MDEFDNIVTLKDESGMDVSFEFLDLLEYQGEEYMVLLPSVIPNDEPNEVVILKVEDTGNPDEESFVGVEDQDKLNAVFELFKIKFRDEFNFID